VSIAVTREVSPAIGRCELGHLERQPIDVARARAQHAAYEARLAELGCEVLRLPPEPDLPDSVFVEDAAIVLDEVAVVTRPGAASRRSETAAVAEALARYRDLVHLLPPARLDGGDVLTIDRTLFVGRSRRTNEEGVRQLARAVAPHGYRVREAAVSGCLHLKSAVTLVAEGTVLIQPAWVETEPFDGLERIEVHAGEPFAANALRIGDAVIYPSNFARSRRRLLERGIRVLTVDVSELAKAEGGVTCCSLIFRKQEPPGP
jgi:dimethylargininase